MSAAAKVVEFAVGMARERYALVLRYAVNDLLLVSVVGYEHAGIITRNLSLNKRSVRTNRQAHLVLNRL